MNAARWWRLDRQLDLKGVLPQAWVAALYTSRPQLVTTFGEGATLAVIGSAPHELTARDRCEPLQVCTWEAGAGTSSAVLVDRSGVLLHEVTAASTDLTRVVALARRDARCEPKAPVPPRPPDGNADASEVLDLLSRAAASSLPVVISVHNRALVHTVRGEVLAVERLGELILVDAGPADLYLDLQRLGLMHLVAGDGTLPELEGVTTEGLAVSMRWCDPVH